MSDKDRQPSFGRKVARFGHAFVYVLVKAVLVALATMVAVFFLGTLISDHVNEWLAVFVWFVVLPISGLVAFFKSLNRAGR